MIQKVNTSSYKSFNQIMAADKIPTISGNYGEKKKDTPHENDKMNNKVLMLSLGVLAVGGAAFLLRRKKISQGKKAENAIENYTDRVKNFLSNIHEDLKAKIDHEVNMMGLEKLTIKKFSESYDELLTLAKVSALNNNKHNIHKHTFPGIINILGINSEKAQETTQILSSKFKGIYDYRKYSGKNLDEFLQMLDNFKSAPDNKQTYLYIENFSKLLADTNKNSSTNLLEKFNKLQNENITCVVSTENAAKFDDIVTLKFNNKLNNEDLSEDLSGYISKQSDIYLPLCDNALEKTAKYADNASNFFLRRGLRPDKNFSVIFFENAKEQLSETFIQELLKITGDRFEKLDCKNENIKNFIAKLTKSLEKQEEKFNLTNKRTYIYLSNLQKIDSSNPDSQKLKELINNAESKYHTTIMLDNKSEELSKNIKKAISVYFKKPKDDIFARAKKQDFSYLYRMQSDELMRLLAPYEVYHTENLDLNGILLYGSDKGTRITAEAIKNCLDVYWSKITFDMSNPVDSFQKMIDQAKIAKQIYQSDNKRVIIEVENLDEALSNKVNASGRKIIGKFKAFAEILDQDYHTTILTRTSKPLASFESAALARFNDKIKIK